MRQAPTRDNSLNGYRAAHARARMRKLQQEHTFSFEPPGTLSRTCVDGSGFLRNSRGRPRVRARGHSSVFPNFADFRDARAAIPPWANPWNVYPARSAHAHKEKGRRFTSQWEPRHARVRAAIPREATLVARGLPQLIASCSFRTRFQRGCISISCECLTMFLPA